MPFNVFLCFEATIVLVCYINFWILISVPFLIGTYWIIRKSYLASSREIKRLEAISRSPLYSFLTTTLEGLASLRVISPAQVTLGRFQDVFIEYLDT